MITDASNQEEVPCSYRGRTLRVGSTNRFTEARSLHLSLLSVPTKKQVTFLRTQDTPAKACDQVPVYC